MEPPDPEVLAFLERLVPPGDHGKAARGGSPGPRAPDPWTLRADNSLAPWTGQPAAGILVTNLAIEGDGGPLPLRLYRPAGKEVLPVLLYFHGGGFVFGNLDEADFICSELAARTPAIVVSVGYRLAPEAPCPAALEDARRALAWTRRAIGAYDGLAGRIGVGGESAGATLAALLCGEAADEDTPMPACQFLLCPWLDLSTFDRPSHRAFGEGPWLSISSLGLYRDWYLGAGKPAADPSISPMARLDLAAQPPTLMLVAGIDPLRDEGLEYARRLHAAGVDTTVLFEEGMIHSFFALGGALSRARPALGRCATALSRLLGHEPRSA